MGTGSSLAVYGLFFGCEEISRFFRRRTALELASVFIMARGAVLIGTMVLCSIWDVRSRQIPNVLTLSSASAGVLFAAVEHGLPGVGWSLGGLLLGAGVLLPGVLAGFIGAGDMKMVGAAGSFLGWLGVLRAVLMGAVLGGIWALAWIVLKKGGRRDTLPYAPPLAAGAILSFFL